jgi:uncharacterized Rossmann fold enzyme
MEKIDKTQYTKEEYRRLKQEKRLAKAGLSESKTPRNIQSDTVFVIGNGTSRTGIDLSILQKYGAIYACNAVYREFDPDYLVAVDVKMILEINRAKYQYKNPNVWTNKNRAYESMHRLNFFEKSKGWSSGPTALWLASSHKPKTVYILGFDFKGLGGNGKMLNNIYADTPNYKRSSDSATYHGNWLRQTETVIKENPHINYIRVMLPDNFDPDELNKFNNYSTVYVSKFIENFA